MMNGYDKDTLRKAQLDTWYKDVFLKMKATTEMQPRKVSSTGVSYPFFSLEIAIPSLQGNLSDREANTLTWNFLSRDVEEKYSISSGSDYTTLVVFWR